MNQIDLFTYTEALELTGPMYLALDVLHTRWLTLDRQYWLDSKYSTGAADYAKALRLGMTEWYPLDLMPEATNQRHVLEPLAALGWIEIMLEHDYWGKVCPGARITADGVDAWKRHQDACFSAWMNRDTLSRKAKLMLPATNNQ